MQRRVPVVLVFRDADLKRGSWALVLAVVLMAMGRLYANGWSMLGTWVSYVAVVLVGLAFHRAYRSAFAEHPHERVAAYFTDQQVVQLAGATGVYVTAYEALRSESALGWALLTNGIINAVVLSVVVVAFFRARARKPSVPD